MLRFPGGRVLNPYMAPVPCLAHVNFLVSVFCLTALSRVTEVDSLILCQGPDFSQEWALRLMSIQQTFIELILCAEHSDKKLSF